MKLNAERRFWARVEKTATCWLWTGRVIGNGHGAFEVNYRGTLVHRFSWELHNGLIPAGLCVCHNCPGGDNKLCVNPDHLWLGTQGQNMNDAARKGQVPRGDQSSARRHPERLPRGEQHVAARLSASQVIEIRRRYQPWKMTLGMLAREFGVARSTVQHVVGGKTWHHIDAKRSSSEASA